MNDGNNDVTLPFQKHLLQMARMIIDWRNLTEINSNFTNPPNDRTNWKVASRRKNVMRNGIVASSSTDEL